MPSNPFNPHSLPLDLFVSALACTSWYKEARPLLGECTDLLFHGFRHSIQETRCIAELPTESRHSGLDYPDQMERIVVDFTRCANEGNYVATLAALETVLSLCPAKLTNLLVNISCPIPTPSPVLYRPFTRPQPLCSSVKCLELFGTEDTGKNHMNDLISALSPHLETLKLTKFTLNSGTYHALGKCTSLREIELNNVGDEERLPTEPEQRHFAYSCNRQRNIDATASVLTVLCPQLESFTLVTSADSLSPAVTLYNMIAFLKRCSGLKRLRIVGNKDVNDWFMFWCLLRGVDGQRLEHIDLEGCTNLVGSVVPKRKGKGSWPKLRSLSLQGCDGVSAWFVKRAVRVCPKLEEVVLPRHLNGEGEIGLAKRGFGCEQNGRWRRVKVKPTLKKDSVRAIASWMLKLKNVSSNER
ncbi:hypothetical protein BC938DRAFT_483207 [Jimgerdemannia flammicorona]|uniref:F-box domain-containing protein n=1 Tax=Jimgerdemannia flammicorona TaxID=994334 RepID=A0A433QCE3_9FUNG|nr:hypothetical protein BC938DRAFT_483207 [Jimgerdemannia flammicorona]